MNTRMLSGLLALVAVLSVGVTTQVDAQGVWKRDSRVDEYSGATTRLVTLRSQNNKMDVGVYCNSENKRIALYFYLVNGIYDYDGLDPKTVEFQYKFREFEGMFSDSVGVALVTSTSDGAVIFDDTELFDYLVPQIRSGKTLRTRWPAFRRGNVSVAWTFPANTDVQTKWATAMCAK